MRYFCCRPIFYESPLMPFIFRSLFLVHYLINNFQPSTPLVTLYMGNNACAKKIGAIQLGSKLLKWGGGGSAHCCPDVEPPLPGNGINRLHILDFWVYIEHHTN